MTMLLILFLLIAYFFFGFSAFVLAGVIVSILAFIAF